MFKLVRLTVGFVMIGGRGHLSAQPEADPIVRIQQRQAYRETVYEVRSGTCRIRWLFSHSEANKGIARHRADCQLPLNEQLELNARILREVLLHEHDFHTLFLGGLRAYPELARRLANSSAKSPKWDVRSGRSRSGTADGYVMELANTSDLFAEWRALFARFHFSLKVTGVEKVSVGPGRVPDDCLIWFSVLSTENSPK